MGVIVGTSWNAIDPRLAARMVNQLKCLRMRKFFQQQNFVSSEFNHRNYP